MCKTSMRAFTLVEILVVTGIIGIILAITIVAINPSRQFQKANDVKRQADINAIHKAVQQFTIAQRGAVPTSIPLDEIYPIGLNIVGNEANICSLIIPTYLAALPKDPQSASTTPITNCLVTHDTGYHITRDDNGRVTVFSLTGTPLKSDGSPVGAAPIAWWKFDESSGTTAANSGSGANLPLTITNATFTAGKYGNMLTTINANSIAELGIITDGATGDQLDFDNTESYTYMTWFKGSPVEAPYPLWKGGTNTSVAGYAIYADGGSTRCYYSSGGGGTPISATTSTSVTDGSWHHLACTVDRSSTAGTYGQIRLYIDGVLAASLPITVTAGTNTSNLSAGELTALYEYTGGVDDVKIYNYVRSQSQIVEDMYIPH